MTEEISLLQQAFAETGVQLDRIIDAYERKQPQQYFRVSDGGQAGTTYFSIKTPYPFVNEAPVTGTLSGESRNGYLLIGGSQYAVYKNTDPQTVDDYIGEFIIDEQAPVVWFDFATQTAYYGIREIITE